MNDWITDWSKIEDDKEYIICAINSNKEGRVWLAQPAAREPGWQVKRYREGCYAALEVPPFKFEGFKT